MMAFNDYLFNIKDQSGLNNSDFAKAIGISSYRYSRFIKGYRHPNKKEIAKIEAYTKESFTPYLEGPSSYPSPVNKNINSPRANKIGKFLNLLAVRISCLILAILGLLCIPAAITVDSINDSSKTNYYNDTYMFVYTKTVEEGSFTTDVLGHFDKRELCIVDSGYYYVSVKAPTDKKGMDETYFEATIREDIYRYTFRYHKRDQLEFVYMDNNTGNYWIYYVYRTGVNKFNNGYYEYHGKTTGYHQNNIASFAPKFQDLVVLSDALFNKLLSTKYQLNVHFYEDILLIKKMGDTRQFRMNTAFNFLAFLGAPIGIAFVVILFASYLYRIKPEEALIEKVAPSQNENQEEKEYSPLPANKPLKFYVSEDVIRIIGVVLLLVGSLRTILSIVANYDILAMVVKDIGIKEIINLTTNAFFLGIFILYIIELDLFSNRKRLFNNLLTYGFLFLTIGIMQTFAVMVSSYLGNGIVNVLNDYVPSNIFGLIFLFFLTAAFLYYLPEKIANNKKLIIVWRLLSLLPLLTILILYIFMKVLPYTVSSEPAKYLSYFFGVERLPFIALTFLYLYGIYFYRLYCQRKYGVANAEIYFRGDHYNLFKNILLAGGALLIGTIELIFHFLVPGIKVDLGQSFYIMLVAPLFILYKPRNGPRKTAINVLSMMGYVAAIFIYYVAVIGIVVLYIIN